MLEIIKIIGQVKNCFLKNIFVPLPNCKMNRPNGSEVTFQTASQRFVIVVKRTVKYCQLAVHAQGCPDGALAHSVSDGVFTAVVSSVINIWVYFVYSNLSIISFLFEKSLNYVLKITSVFLNFFKFTIYTIKNRIFIDKI